MNMPLRLITVNSQVQKLLNLILKKVTSTIKAGMREVMSKCKQGCNPWHTGAGVVRCILSGILNTIPKSITLIHATFHLEPSVKSIVMHNVEAACIRLYQAVW